MQERKIGQILKMTCSLQHYMIWIYWMNMQVISGLCTNFVPSQNIVPFLDIPMMIFLRQVPSERLSGFVREHVIEIDEK